MAFLELKDVCKSYGSARGASRVLKNVSLAVEQGEFVAVLGFSGSGKTTLISLLAGLLQPDSGTISLRGKPITGPGSDRGIVFQNYALLPWLSALENVKLGLDQAHRDWSAERRREHAVKYLTLVNLGHALDKKPGELSGGMRQRVSVARALAMEPEVLLLDEPLSALDALTRASLQDEIDRIREQEKKTIVLVTNDVDEGILLADRIVPLTPGPDATFGPDFHVKLPRPRDRKSLNHDEAFKRLRNDVIRYLSGMRRGPSLSRDSEPEVGEPRLAFEVSG
ncbi:MAG TPA: ABC transporter ATP-binding protein [Polyangiaceae bacterium]|nr:ABC transporter ATP-binding protein [Polyangiaceae bacterium]